MDCSSGDDADQIEVSDELEDYIDNIHPDGIEYDCSELLFYTDDSTDNWFAWVPKPDKQGLDDWVFGWSILEEDEEAHERYSAGQFTEQELEELVDRFYQSRYESDIWHRVTVSEATGSSGRSIFVASQTGEYGMGIDKTAHSSLKVMREWYSDHGRIVWDDC